MKEMICSICSYTYDESKGIPEAGIAPGTPWEDLPADWQCPVCKAGKSAFREKNTAPAEKSASVPLVADKELSAMEMSVICSNLARGCEKQYLPDQAAQFGILADFFRAQSTPAEQPELSGLLSLIRQDLSAGYPAANATASEHHDRGALRSLVWSEKVTRMLESLLQRLNEEGESMLEHTGVYVCTICGFVYVGDAPPALCPVCKVPDWKFEKAERRA